MSSFSERNGYKAPRSIAQVGSLDGETRMNVWNKIALIPDFLDRNRRFRNNERMVAALWTESFGRPRDEVPGDPARVWRLVKRQILEGAFNECMDIIEDVAHIATSPLVETDIRDYAERVLASLNEELARDLVGYRLLNNELVPLDSEVEVAAVEEAAGQDVPAAAREHLEAALSLLSDREAPDYRNSVKESVTAVESLARKITGARTLGEALPKLSMAGIETHGALVRAWSGFYGYTSDAGGVRHGGETIAKVDQALAKYVLVTCSAFVTWLTEEARLAGKL